MTSPDIAEHLRLSGYDAEWRNDGKQLRVQACIGTHDVELIHFFDARPLEKLPAFFLVDAPRFGQLAHVRIKQASGLGVVCVDDSDSISVNFEAPHLAFEESLSRHVSLLDRLLGDPNWNRAELLREFHANWEILCDSVQPSPPTMFFATTGDRAAELRIKRPAKGFKLGVRGHFLALGREDCREDILKVLRDAAAWEKRQESGRGIHLAIDHFDPAPASLTDLPSWYVSAVARIPASDADAFSNYRNRQSKEHWVVLSSEVESGIATCAVHLKSKRKGPVPVTHEELEAYESQPVTVRSLTASSLLPRGGASPSLAESSVLLVGCGAVGSEVAQRLAAVGVGELVVSDPDLFREDNLYRHSLDLDYIDLPKAAGVVYQLRRKYPWIRASSSTNRLLTWVEPLRDKSVSFDLVVVAIGSPTSERLFVRELQQAGVQIPVLNTWVEAYGVGGHAVLGLPGARGCLFCAYVDPETLLPGLASNLNFLAPNQLTTRNHAGCGNRFLPYSAIAAGYTATITADLAARLLQGGVEHSSKVSWLGPSEAAEKEGLDFSHRYRHFKRSLEVLRSKIPSATYAAVSDVIFSHGKTTASVAKDVLEIWDSHRQLEPGVPEACGVIIGSTSPDWRELWVESVSTPQPGDKRTRHGFVLQDPHHQRLVDDAFEASGGTSIYLGTWHTHPEASPTPSRIDRSDWVACLGRNSGRALVFAIVGTKDTHLYCRGRVRFRRMKQTGG